MESSHLRTPSELSLHTLCDFFRETSDGFVMISFCLALNISYLCVKTLVKEGCQNVAKKTMSQLENFLFSP